MGDAHGLEEAVAVREIREAKSGKQNHFEEEGNTEGEARQERVSREGPGKDSAEGLTPPARRYDQPGARHDEYATDRRMNFLA